MLPGLLQPPSETLFFALFAHDFNLLYLRRLLGASWLTDGWDFDSAPPGAFITFELWKAEAERDGTHTYASHAEGGDDGGRDHEADGYRVRASFTAASFAQQRSASPLVPPHEPPSGAQ